MEIIFSDEQMPESSVAELFHRGGELCEKEAGLYGARLEVSVTFASLDEIRELNMRFREKDSVTDVLSFPQYSDLNDIPRDRRVSIGDVVICEEKAILQAEEFGHSYKRELLYLFLHGILHLLTYDHELEADKKVMRNIEENILLELEMIR